MILLTLVCVTSPFLFSQQMPIDFSDTQENFTGFGGSSFSFRSDPDDASNTVGEFSNNGAVQQGFFLDLSREIDLDFQKTISLSFYAFDSDTHTITLKLENGINPDVEITQSVTGLGWTNNIVFDFANATLSSNGSPINASGTYNRLTIFIDIASATSGTYLIDAIDDGSTETDPNELDVIYDVLVWSDEFDTDGPVDASKWHHQTFGPNGGQWFNGELQHYTDSQTNSFVSGGFLNIVAKRETIDQNGVVLDFSSARLNSKFAFTYGRVDVRARLPFGNGTWPAIWTLGKNISEVGGFWYDTFGDTAWPACGEIDIMEHGLHSTNEVSCAIHTPSSFGNTVNTDTQMLADVANDFHVYSVNWSPNQITFLIDDVGYYTYKPAVQNSNTWPFDLDQYLLLNVAMGGFAGAVDAGFSESAMVIDYVRVYQSAALSTTSFTNDMSLRVYPNPTTDLLNLVSEHPMDEAVLYNVLGKEILRKPLGETRGRLDVSTVAKGVYFLNIFGKNTRTVRKVVVQ